MTHAQAPAPARVRAVAIAPGAAAVISVRARPGEAVVLRGYTTPVRTYRILRSGTTDGSGLISFHLRTAASAGSPWKYDGCGRPDVTRPSSGVACGFYTINPGDLHGVVIELGMSRDFRAESLETIG